MPIFSAVREPKESDKEWHKWFVWRPLLLEEFPLTVAWFTTLERRKVWAPVNSFRDPSPLYFRWAWEYRPPLKD
jgi:hypothetical protein